MSPTASSDLWPDNSDTLLDKLLGEYAASSAPVEVDFRNDVSWVQMGERLTHGIHPYPARIIRHIPILFVHSQRYSAPGDLVVDPFCGSGTVLLEALAAGRRVLGADANPLARLISQAKTTPLSESLLSEATKQTLARIPKDVPPAPWVVNANYWYTNTAIEQLSRLRVAVDMEPDEAVRTFLQVCFSLVVRRSSLADPRISVPVKLRRNKYAPDHWLYQKANAILDSADTYDVFADFSNIAYANGQRVASLVTAKVQNPGLAVPSEDARSLTSPSGEPLGAGAARLIITSPPYLGAQKYIRASSLSLGWLGFNQESTLREFEDQTIGREHFRNHELQAFDTDVTEADRLIETVRAVNPLRAHIATTYLREMREALQESWRILCPGGSLVLVTGNNRLCGQPFHTTAYLIDIATTLGLVVDLELVDTIRSRGLMTRRNTSAGLIETEAVTVFRKPIASNG